MAIRRLNFCYDEEKDSLVYLGIQNHHEASTSAYLRKCVEFYEMNKSGAVSSQLILENLLEIKKLLKGGAVVVATEETADDQANQIFDSLLEQLG